ALAIGLLQLVLDRGNQEDWFGSQLIVVSAIACVLAFAFFFVYSLTGKHHPLFDLRLFTDRNFLVASLVITATSVGFFGGMVLQSLYMQNFLGYPTFEAGLYMAPRGLASFFVMMFVGKFSGKIPPRNFVFVGTLCSIAGNGLMTNFSDTISPHDLIIPLMLQGMGMGLIFVPISSLAFATLPKTLAAEAAGIYSLIRSIASAVGIAILATYLSRSTQQQWGELRGHINPFNGALTDYLHPLHMGLDETGIALAARAVFHQAQNGAYIDSFWFATINFVVMLPLLLLIRSPKPGAGQQPAQVTAD
ncbi:MAG TPA: MFS transporter, partial [Moraxellaceae bacterium]|nr:MFS transporter [Moraxellaceae bacterium]